MQWDFWFGKRRWERRMDAEFRFHLQNQMDDYVRQGLSRNEAERRARQEFGAIELAKDECRDERPGDWIGHLLRDVRLAARQLRKSPGFAAAALLTIALGVGANSAIFSVVYSVLLKPLPYASPEQLYAVDAVIPERQAQFPSLPVPVQIFLEWRRASTNLSAIAALRPWECNLTGDGEPERLAGARVSANFFSVLGVPVARGREFSREDEQPGNEKVVVISDTLWRRRYAGDPRLVGRKIRVNGETHVVVGIAAASLLVPTGTMMNPVLPFGSRVDLWKPIAPTPAELRGESWDHGVIARLPKGTSAERTKQQFQALLTRYFQQQAPGMKIEVIPRLIPIRDIYAGRIATRLLLVFAAAAVLLLIACTNFANLLLSRSASRSAEFATRIALGAGQGRIIRQTLTETTLLALLGGSIGLLVAGLGVEVLTTSGPEDVRVLAGSGWNLPVFLFGLAASIATGFVCGVLPARQAYRRDAAAGLREGAKAAFRGYRSAGIRRLLVGVEVALSMTLLVTSGLLLHSFVNVMRADRGYDLERVVAIDLSLFGQRYDTGERRTAFWRELTSKVRSLPGILAAGAITDLPAAAGSSGASRTIFHPTDTDFQNLVLARPVAMIRGVTGGYFAATGTGLRAGRFFTDREQSLVALISESLARSLWPRDHPAAAVGRTVRQGNVRGPLIAIVGVVQDVRSGAVDRDLPPILYRPYEQWASGPATLVAKTAQDPAGLFPAIRTAVRTMDRDISIPPLRTIAQIVAEAVAQRRYQTLLTSLFAVLALLLGAVGVYGVVSYSVSCRTQDIGLRLAVGARESDVMRWVFRHGMQPVIFGVGAGFAGAFGAARVLKSQLYGISSIDPVSYGTVVLALLLTSAIACYLPARRAARLDPTVALRHD